MKLVAATVMGWPHLLPRALATCAAAWGPVGLPTPQGDVVALMQSVLLPTAADPKASTPRERISQLEAAKARAVEMEDYDMAKELKREIGILLGESDIGRLQVLKQAAIADEDFDLAKDLKWRIQMLKNSTNLSAGAADAVKALYTMGPEPLPWGWRSAKDPNSGMMYYWPVNDRSAVTWERPIGPASPATAPVPAAAMRTTTTPAPFEVRGTNGNWSPCSIAGNGSQPGRYNISVRSSKGILVLPDIPGTVIRNATDRELLVPLPPQATTPGPSFKSMASTNTSLAQHVIKAFQVGDRLELRGKGSSWVPCIVTGMGNGSDTYNIHLPFAPVNHREYFNVPISVLRKATLFTNESSTTEVHKERSGKAAETFSEAQREQASRAAKTLAEAYWIHKKQTDPKKPEDSKDDTDPKDDKGAKAVGTEGSKLEELKASLQGLQGNLSSLQALLYTTGAAVHSTSQAAFFIPDDGVHCVQGEPDYINAKLSKLKASPLNEKYLHAEVRAGSCTDQGYTEGPSPDVCLSKANLYRREGQHFQDMPYEGGLLAAYGRSATAQGFMQLCD